MEIAMNNEFRRAKAMPESLWKLADVPEAPTEISLASLKKIFEAERYEQIALNGLNAESAHANSVLEGVWRIITGLDEPLEMPNAENNKKG